MYISSPKRLVKSNVLAEYHSPSLSSLSVRSLSFSLSLPATSRFRVFHHAAMLTYARPCLFSLRFHLVAFAPFGFRIKTGKSDFDLYFTLAWTAAPPNSPRVGSNLRAHMSHYEYQHMEGWCRWKLCGAVL